MAIAACLCDHVLVVVGAHVGSWGADAFDMPCSQIFHLDPLRANMERNALNMVLPYADSEYVLTGLEDSSRSWSTWRREGLS